MATGKPSAADFEAHADDPTTLWGLMAGMGETNGVQSADSSEALWEHFEEDPRTAAAVMEQLAGRGLTSVRAVVEASTPRQQVVEP